MAKLLVLLVASALVATCCIGVEGNSSMRGLMEKLSAKRNRHANHRRAPVGAYGVGAQGAAYAAAPTYGNPSQYQVAPPSPYTVGTGTGTSSGAAAAAAAVAPPARYSHVPVTRHQVPPVQYNNYHRYQQPRPVYRYQPQVAPRYGPVPAPAHNVYRSAPRVGSAATSAAATGNTGAAAAGAATGGGSSASSAAVGTGAGAGAGAGAAAATGVAASTNVGTTRHAAPEAHNHAVTEVDDFEEHFSVPEHTNSVSSATGTFLNDDHGMEESSYVRSTEDETNHEDGKRDDNHYYQAGSYGKTYDENKHEAFNEDDEDVEHTPNLFRSRKSKTNYVMDKNKSRTESGSNVEAHDRHSSAYNKNSRRFKENVDQRNHKEGAGIVEASNASSSSNIDDEDEEVYDSDALVGRHAFVGVNGQQYAPHPGHLSPANRGGAVGASASAANGVSTSAATAGRATASGAAAASH